MFTYYKIVKLYTVPFKRHKNQWMRNLIAKDTLLIRNLLDKK